MKASSVYNGSLTREQFLFHEMRITANLLISGFNDEDIIHQIIDNNLFQYPTERSVKNLATVCLRRLHCLEDMDLIHMITSRPVDVSKQVCLYAMMKQNRLVRDFMITVVGEKYRLMDESFGRIDVNTFFIRLQEQDDGVASWSESTVKKIKSVLIGILVDNGYLDNNRSTKLNPVLIDRKLEKAIRSNHDEAALAAFNCFI